MKNSINQDLIKYIEKDIFPIYNTFDEGHNLNHIFEVIKRAIQISGQLENIDINIVYAAAALHDIGIKKERKNHALHSATFVRNATQLKSFFTDDEIIIIAEAVEDHSTSKGITPRSIYGKIVADADKDDNIDVALLRAYKFTKKYFPDFTEEECIKNVHEQLIDKFGLNGKVKFYIQSEKHISFMHQMRLLAENELKFKYKLKSIILKSK